MFIVKQYIYKDILRARTVNDREVELSKYFSLTSLALVQLLYNHEVFERTIVSPDVHDRIHLYEVRALLLEALDDRKQLLVMNQVIQLYRGQAYQP